MNVIKKVLQGHIFNIRPYFYARGKRILQRKNAHLYLGVSTAPPSRLTNWVGNTPNLSLKHLAK